MSAGFCLRGTFCTLTGGTLIPCGRAILTYRWFTPDITFEMTSEGLNKTPLRRILRYGHMNLSTVDKHIIYLHCGRTAEVGRKTAEEISARTQRSQNESQELWKPSHCVYDDRCRKLIGFLPLGLLPLGLLPPGLLPPSGRRSLGRGSLGRESLSRGSLGRRC